MIDKADDNSRIVRSLKIDSRGEISVEPLAGHIGAQVHGLKLNSPLAPPELEAVCQALEKYRVLFFESQFLDHRQQVEFTQQLGKLAPSHPWLPPVPGYPSVHPLITGRTASAENLSREQAHRARWRRPDFLSGWHCDLTAAVDPPSYGVLRAEKLTSRGGDTVWTNLVAAYETLSPPMRQLADALTAEHRYLVDYVPFGLVDEYSRTAISAGLIARHPVVRVLSESGARALFVNPSFTSHIIELSPPESRRVLDLFFSHLAQQEFTVRHRWQIGDVAVWDNRATAHAGPEDHEHLGEERAMYRVFVAGEPAKGPQGQRSVAISGSPFQLS